MIIPRVWTVERDAFLLGFWIEASWSKLAKTADICRHIKDQGLSWTKVVYKDHPKPGVRSMPRVGRVGSQSANRMFGFLDKQLEVYLLGFTHKITSKSSWVILATLLILSTFHLNDLVGFFL
jgi:hypothetical protein